MFAFLDRVGRNVTRTQRVLNGLRAPGHTVVLLYLSAAIHSKAPLSLKSIPLSIHLLTTITIHLMDDGLTTVPIAGQELTTLHNQQLSQSLILAHMDIEYQHQMVLLVVLLISLDLQNLQHGIQLPILLMDRHGLVLGGLLQVSATSVAPLLAVLAAAVSIGRHLHTFPTPPTLTT